LKTMNENFKTAKVWEELKHLKPEDVMARSLSRYDENDKAYLLDIINQEYSAKLDESKVVRRREKKAESAPWQLQILVPIYLINAKQEKLQRRWISPYELEGGGLFFSAPAHNLVFNDLLEKYSSPSQFLKAGLALDGKKTALGDAAFEILVLPRIPILYVFRSGGDEFSDNINVFFDASAKSHLPTDSLWLIIEYSKKCLLELDVSPANNKER